ncbi:hypothetical protein [cf. Phormidesmis sp. LEGE 11477]|uniref:hypothetical protein n=1 Tax=cf. Phormidesmis sp. LEGE 11477 TaxID=1828680 RepID=UPI00187E52B5|nr:hypothetical protein [cf. Phormidesmis sp. LEGE 11477]MBE9064046.1 hypothetical protein [cf. Phormidesmis sp. LEGE 11477]
MPTRERPQRFSTNQRHTTLAAGDGDGGRYGAISLPKNSYPQHSTVPAVQPLALRLPYLLIFVQYSKAKAATTTAATGRGDRSW